MIKNQFVRSYQIVKANENSDKNHRSQKKDRNIKEYNYE